MVVCLVESLVEHLAASRAATKVASMVEMRAASKVVMTGKS